jgi:hypothetical protein
VRRAAAKLNQMTPKRAWQRERGRAMQSDVRASFGTGPR